MLSLFEKRPDNHIELLPAQESVDINSLDDVRARLIDAASQKRFSQLVIVGSASDIAWAQALLPESVHKYIVAEIHYPLLPAWFSQAANPPLLSNAIEHLFRH